MNNHHRIFIDNNIRLVRTLAVKFEDAAWLINKSIVAEHGQRFVDPENPRSWKYYQNMSGKAHALDTVPTINSLDDPEQTIEFTKQELAKHPLTRTSYLYGSRYYADLVQRYPNQELLILGVLYAPADDAFIDRLIAAPDATIVYWDARYVEINEYDLMPDLQTWAYQYVKRWVNVSYTLIDELYPALYMGQFALHALQQLLCLRSCRLKTPQTHSYYVREYLRSHGMLDRYIAQLTLKQALFLYRNIRYIEANSGKQEIFEWLVENIMTERNLPLYEHVVRHDISAMINYDNSIASLQPSIVFKRKPVNFITSTRTEEHRTVQQIMSAMDAWPAGNADEHFFRGHVIENKMVNSDSNIVKTKLLESIADDISDVVPYALTSVLINHLFYYVCSGIYAPRVEFQIAGTGRSLFLSAKECLTLCTYCWLSTAGIAGRLNDQGELIETFILPFSIPQLLVADFNPLSLADQSKMRQMVSKLEAMSAPDSFPKHQAKQLIEVAYQRELTPTVEVEDFYNHCVELHRRGMYFANAIGDAGDFYATAEMENWVDHLYTQKELELLPSVSNSAQRVSYEKWISSKGLFTTPPTLEQLHEIGQNLLDKLTGIVSMRGSSIKDVQRAMIDIMKRLSSYTIHFISDVNESELTTVPNALHWGRASGGYSVSRVFVDVQTGHVIETMTHGSDWDELFEEDLNVRVYDHHDRVFCEMIGVLDDPENGRTDPLFGPIFSHTEIETLYPDSFITTDQ